MGKTYYMSEHQLHTLETISNVLRWKNDTMNFYLSSDILPQLIQELYMQENKPEVIDSETQKPISNIRTWIADTSPTTRRKKRTYTKRNKKYWSNLKKQ